MKKNYSLQYSLQPKRFRINCTFRYDNIIWDSSYRNSAIISSLLAGNPIGSLMDQGMNYLSNAISNLYESSESDIVTRSHDSI